MHSGGSLRNAENLLEKCFITIKDKNLEKESIEKVLGIINEEVPAKILTHLLDNNQKIFSVGPSRSLYRNVSNVLYHAPQATFP